METTDSYTSKLMSRMSLYHSDHLQYGKDYYTLHFRTEWTDCDNIVVSLYEPQDAMAQCGIVEVKLFKTGNRKGEAYIWNLYVCEDCREKGYGRALLSDAISIAELADCSKASLEWDDRDSPKWVLDWYVREGFEEREFGRGYAYMIKDLK